jgi:ATP-dependent DNA helicase RecQ
MHDPELVVAGLDRPNIYLAVERYEDAASQETGLISTIEALAGEELARPGIVYCATRKSTEQVAERLRESGLRAEAYHAAMPAKQRQTLQDAFMADNIDVLVATKAFGLGIDKPNVRFVIHFDVPQSLDELYQEAGRAGRDGKPASAILLYRPADLHLPHFFAGGRMRNEDIDLVLNAVGRGSGWTRSAIAEATGLSSRTVGRIVNHLVDIDALRLDSKGRVRGKSARHAEEVEAESESAQEKRHALVTSRIDMMRAYAETEACRRQLLLSYFGESIEPCGRCDNCKRGLAPEQRKVETAPEETIQHRAWGEGTVLRVEEGRAYAFFKDAGYRVIDLTLAEENDLIAWK